jgi:HSP20 family protein
MHDPFFSFSHYGLQLTAIMPTHPEAAWQPAVDLYRCAEGWVVKFELAGVRQEDFQVRWEAGGITGLGTRLDRRPYQLEEAHLMEIAYSRFERYVPLPEPIHDVQYRVDFHDGMLYVHVLRSGEISNL